MPILPLTNTVDIYRNSDELLKNMPKDTLKTIENDMFYSKKKVENYGRDNDVRAHYTTANATAPKRTAENLTKKIEQFHGHLEIEYIYRTPLK